MYETTTELIGDMPVYVMVGGKSRLFFDSGNQWKVKSGDTNMMFCNADKKCLPHECPVGKWKVWHGNPTFWEDQPAVTVANLPTKRKR